MFNKRKKDIAIIKRDVRTIKRMLLESDQRPFTNRVVVETLTKKPTSGKMYRNVEVARKLGLRPKQFDGLRRKTNNKPAQGGSSPNDPALWTYKQILWFQDYLDSGAYKTRRYTTRNRNSSKRKVQV